MGDDVAGELFGVSGVVFEVSVIGHACSRVVDIANKGVGVVLAAKGVNVVVELCFAIFIGGEWDKEEDNEDQDDEDDNCNKEDSKLIFFVAFCVVFAEYAVGAEFLAVDGPEGIGSVDIAAVVAGCGLFVIPFCLVYGMMGVGGRNEGFLAVVFGGNIFRNIVCHRRDRCAVGGGGKYDHNHYMSGWRVLFAFSFSTPVNRLSNMVYDIVNNLCV